MLMNSLPHAHKWSIHCVQLLRILNSYVAMVPVGTLCSNEDYSKMCSWTLVVLEVMPCVMY